MLETVGFAVAVILALVDEIRARGQSLVGWAVVIGFGVLLLGRLG